MILRRREFAFSSFLAGNLLLLLFFIVSFLLCTLEFFNLYEKSSYALPCEIRIASLKMISFLYYFSYDLDIILGLLWTLDS